MKKLFLRFMVSMAILTPFVLASCSDTNDEPTIPPVTESELSGSIKTSKTLDANITYTITGPVIVEDGATLTIPAGTVIKAEKGFSNYILVLQGGKIYVNGTADKPVVMTADISNAEAGHWGGLIINGRAPLAGNTTGSTEINAAYIYGGNNPADNSGSITYLKLEFTGAKSSADVEHNGLTLNGVGNGTKIENIFVIEGADDAIEFFGGTVNVKNILAVNPDDDMFDFTQGYTGTLENAYGIWEAGYSSSESDPRGIEADGNWDGLTPDQQGQSNFRVINMTIDLKLPYNTTDVKKQMQDAIKIRRGAKATITNALIKGTGAVQDLVDFTDGKGAGDATSNINLTNQLTNPILGKNTNGTGIVTFSDNNTGCASNIFTWTGYTNF
jgi:hypothetical protein